MEKRIRERFTPSILQAALERFAADPARVRELDGFESFIYEFTRDDGVFILRIGHSLRRSVPLICGEVDWINYLARGGAGVAQAIHSAAGNLVERLPDGQGEYFLAVAFTRAAGHSPLKSDWNESSFETWGATLGRMHALSKDYAPGDPAWRRPEWDAPIMSEVERLLPPSESIAVDRFRELMAHLQALPRDRESYGLIHQDAHGGNLFVDDAGRITLFDFDDCCYSWFVNDIAIVLFYALLDSDIVVQSPEDFLLPFLRGYGRENRLDPAWLAEIPHFCKLREIDLYAVIHRSFDVDHIDNAWIARYMRGRKERIERGVPYVELDWSSLPIK